MAVIYFEPLVSQQPPSKNIDHTNPIHINKQVPLLPGYGVSMVEHSLPQPSR